MEEEVQDAKSYSEILSSPDFYYWLKTTFAIYYTGNGLKEYVTETMLKFHKKLVRKVYSEEQVQSRSFCRHCPLESIIFSSHCLCYNLKREIIKHHNHYSYLVNTNPSSWCTDTWEVTKCYLPKMYTNHSSIEDLDFHAIISLMLNLDAFGKKHKIFDAARGISNDVRHASSLCCTEQKMNAVFHSMLEVLNCADGTKVANTKEELHKLKAKDFQISHGEFTKIIRKTQETETKSGELLKPFLDHQKDTDYTQTLQQHIASAIGFYEIKHGYRNDGLSTEQRRKQLKEDLLVFNIDTYSRIPLQPVFEVYDALLFEYYVEQRMSRMKHGLVPNEHQAISLQHILDEEPGRDIYLVSKAGGGKTVFCKWLAMLWCHAHHDSETESEYVAKHTGYIEAMKKYAFVFLITLRHSKAESNVDIMIQHQIIKKLSHSASYTITDLQALLHDENCLIILDGLDEWTHPNLQQCDENDIPERNKRRGCTFITTSRPWKFHMLSKLSSLTLCFELKGFDEHASRKFITNALSNLGTTNPESRVEDVQKAIKAQRLCRFKVSPLTLSFLVCLWQEYHGNIGRTITEIYCNLIGLFLSGAENKKLLNETACPPPKKPRIVMPKLVESNAFCAKYYGFLLKYGELAFVRFFDNRRENSLAFDIACVDGIIDNDYIELGLNIGFLTEERHCELFGKTRKLSFVHKTFQEFFAALYISSIDGDLDLLNHCFDMINSACKSLNNVLTVSHFYIFLFGICPKTAYKLSKDFGKTVTEDKYIYNFRRDMGSWSSFECYNKTAKDLQDLVVFSVEESREINRGQNVNVPIILEDIIIDDDFTTDANYQRTLESILRVNRKNIKSIKIRGIKDNTEFRNILDCLGGKELLNPLVKIDCKCTFSPNDMDLLLHASEKTLECFVIKGGKWLNDKWVHTPFNVPDNTCNLVQRLKSIKVLYLRNVTVPHGHLEALMQYLEERESMKQMGLTYIECKDHTAACVSLDLSRGDQLSVLEIGTLPLVNVKLNTHSLETCYIGEFNEHGVFATIMNALISASKLSCFRCGFLTKERNIAVLLESIPKLTNINIMWLINLDLTQYSIELSKKMSRLESITLLRVLLQCSSLENITNTLESMNQSVKVGLFSCGGSEQDPRFEEVKGRLEQSDKFRVLLDGQDEDRHHEYMFESIGKS